MKHKFFFTVVIACLLTVVSCSTINQNETKTSISDDDVNRVASQLYCPICQNVPLDVCPSQACADWRELIRSMMADGKSDNDIKTYFAEQYGWNALSMPPRIGFNWLIYVLPPIIIIAGLFYIFVTLKKRASENKDLPDSIEQKSLSDSVLETIDRDLKDID